MTTPDDAVGPHGAQPSPPHLPYGHPSAQLPYGSPPQPPYGQLPYGPPPQPPYGPLPYGPPPIPAAPRRRKWWLLVAAVVVMAGVAGLVVYEHHKNSDPSKIKALIGAFSETVATANPQKIAHLLCREEAEPFLDSVAEPDSGGVAHPQAPKFTIRSVVVHGNAASATLEFHSGRTQTMYFRKEDRKWTVCAPAKAQL